MLVDLNPEDIRDPLAQFNHTRPVEADMFKLVSSINRGLESKGLKESVLASSFKTYWPQFQDGFDKIITDTEASTIPEKPRAQEDILSEILNSVRGIDKRVRQIEGKALSDDEPYLFKSAEEFRNSDAYRIAKELIRAGYTDTEAMDKMRASIPGIHKDLLISAISQVHTDLYRVVRPKNQSTK